MTIRELKAYVNDRVWLNFLVTFLLAFIIFNLLDFIRGHSINWVSACLKCLVLTPLFMLLNTHDEDAQMAHYYYADGQYDALKKHFEDQGYTFQSLKKYELGKNNKMYVELRQLNGVVKVSCKTKKMLENIPERFLPVQYATPRL